MQWLQSNNAVIALYCRMCAVPAAWLPAPASHLSSCSCLKEGNPATTAQCACAKSLIITWYLSSCSMFMPKGRKPCYHCACAKSLIITWYLSSCSCLKEGNPANTAHEPNHKRSRDIFHHVHALKKETLLPLRNAHAPNHEWSRDICHHVHA